jgi:hypothetical protein
MHGIEHDMSYNPRIIQAHTGELAAIALNPAGTLLATASKRVCLEKNIFPNKKKLISIFLGNVNSCIFHDRFMRKII